jgi:hypothetical protein
MTKPPDDENVLPFPEFRDLETMPLGELWLGGGGVEIQAHLNLTNDPPTIDLVIYDRLNHDGVPAVCQLGKRDVADLVRMISSLL